jgi:hypothetical protein
MVNVVRLYRSLALLVCFSLDLNAKCEIPTSVQPFVPEWACQLADPDTWNHANNSPHANFYLPQTAGSCGIRSISGENSSIKNHSGQLNLLKCTIKNSLSVQGPCTAKDTDFNGGLTVSGPTTIQGKKHTVSGLVTIQGGLWTDGMLYADMLDIVGYLEATHCEFYKDIIIRTTRITLQNCVVDGNLTIDDREDHPVTIMLDHCTIAGTIRAKSGHGIIYSKDSNITSKNVIGAAIQ